ncbi:helix-turn-helix transcriptional regulator [Streptosporangiaceae bacterium NEAU-GS5]|nr:helix-turn-helix transcriptional regulator [Streptosporangiaceae bacterium NEAU-GS5]
MGNREDLIAGATRCLYEKGYARTTARDIASAAGVSLAAIGYHFGSTKALLNEAIFKAMEEWGEEVERALAAVRDADPAERFEAVWSRVTESFTTRRALWAVQFEVVTQLDQFPGVRDHLLAGYDRARLGLAELFGTPGSAELGAFYQTLLAGMLVQWLTDPGRAPTGHDLAGSIRKVAAVLEG